MVNEAPFILPQKPDLRKQVWGAWATIGLGLAIGLVFFVSQVLVVIAFVISKVVSNPGADLIQEISNLATDGSLVSISIIVSAVTGFGLIALFIRLRGIGLGGYLAFKRISWKTVIILILLTAALVVLAGLASMASGDTQNSGFMVGAYSTAGWLPLLWIAAIVFGPVFEESFFRGFLFTGLQNSRIGVIGTILFTSAAWAVLHIQYDIYGIATILILGVVLGAVRLKTGSLWGSILVHSLWNFVAMVGTMLSLGAGN